MTLTLFSSASVTIASLLSGLAFGFLLRKGGVARFDTIVSQLLLKDFTVMKVMFTAIVVGSAGIYLSDAGGVLPGFHLSTTPVVFAVLGGAIFGVGMATAGYCPGTAVAALAEGSKDVLFVIAGLLTGAALYNAFSEGFMALQAQQDTFYQKTLADLLSVPPLAVVAGLAIVWGVFVVVLKRCEQKGSGV